MLLDGTGSSRNPRRTEHFRLASVVAQFWDLEETVKWQTQDTARDRRMGTKCLCKGLAGGLHPRYSGKEEGGYDEENSGEVHIEMLGWSRGEVVVVVVGVSTSLERVMLY